MTRIFCLALLLVAGCDATNSASITIDEIKNSRWLLDRVETETGEVSTDTETEKQAGIMFGSPVAEREGSFGVGV